MWKKIVIKHKEWTYFFFISVFNFFDCNLDSMQALFHACLPLLDFLGPGYIVLDGRWTTFTNTKGRLIGTFSFALTYLHTIESACSKQVRSNGSNKSILLHDTIEVRALAHACKLDFSSSTKAIILWVKENLSNSFYNLGTIAALLMFKTLNKLMVTCFAS